MRTDHTSVQISIYHNSNLLQTLQLSAPDIAIATLAGEPILELQRSNT